MLVEIKRISKIETTVVSSLDVAETFGKDMIMFLKILENLIAVTSFDS